MDIDTELENIINENFCKYTPQTEILPIVLRKKMLYLNNIKKENSHPQVLPITIRKKLLFDRVS